MILQGKLEVTAGLSLVTDLRSQQGQTLQSPPWGRETWIPEISDDLVKNFSKGIGSYPSVQINYPRIFDSYSENSNSKPKIILIHCMVLSIRKCKLLLIIFTFHFLQMPLTLLNILFYEALNIDVSEILN